MFRFTWTARTAFLAGFLSALIPIAAARAMTTTSVNVAPKANSAAVATETAAKAVGTRTLRRGDSGPRVRALQTLLASVGFKTTANGKYDKATVKTVRKFQRATVITVNGVANAATLKRLKKTARGQLTTSAHSSAGGADARSESLRAEHLGDRIPLRPGMSGQDVRVLQSYLRQAGFRAKVTGEFDARTAGHVKRFERANESRDVDGTMDANELAILRADVEGADDTDISGVDATRTTPGEKAKLGSNGLAIAPESAPDEVKQIIAAGNEIAKKPYVYGGGHGKWKDRGYDCSGSISYALHGADLLKAPLPSGPFMSWGASGKGDWVTIYAHGGHAYMVVAGLRFDTSGRSGTGSRWQTDMRSSSGFAVRHPKGL